MNKAEIEFAEYSYKRGITGSAYKALREAFMAGYSAAPPAAPVAAVPDESELHYNAQRLRNVAQLVGLEKAIPPDDATLDGARGAVLGMIARRLSKPDVAEMVNRFLGWPMPKNFSPDGGMTFKAPTHPNSWPIGTNLLNADQAKAMFEHCLATPPSDGVTSPDAPPLDCHCEACEPNTFERQRMILCATCGNKRCPHAADHRNVCTASNEPGQKGSSWENYPSHSTVTIAATAAQAVGVDTPELRELVDCYVRFFSTDEPGEKGEEYWRAIIAHITNLVTSARQEGMEKVEKWRKLAAIQRETVDVVRKVAIVRADLARQEGREKALEEAATCMESNIHLLTVKEHARRIRALSSVQPGEQGEG